MHADDTKRNTNKLNRTIHAYARMVAAFRLCIRSEGGLVVERRLKPTYSVLPPTPLCCLPPLNRLSPVRTDARVASLPQLWVPVPAEEDIVPIVPAVQQKEGHRAHPWARCPPEVADVETGKGTQATESQTSTAHDDNFSLVQRHTIEQTCSGIVDSMRQNAKRI
jgi:hypothetical protein